MTGQGWVSHFCDILYSIFFLFWLVQGAGTFLLFLLLFLFLFGVVLGWLI